MKLTMISTAMINTDHVTHVNENHLTIFVEDAIEVDSGHSTEPEVVIFVKIVNRFEILKIFTGSFTLNISKSSGFAFVLSR